MNTMTTKPNASQHRMPGLDALRGIAALLVVIYHYTIVYKTVAEHKDPLWFSFPYPALGVQIFFVISGFVIFMTLERCKRGMDFTMSRFARLYPPFIFCMLLTALVAWLSGFNPRDVDVIDVLSHLPMAVGVFSHRYIDGSYWTLTAEICFYTLIALFFYQIQQRWYQGRSSFDGVTRNPLVYGMLLWMVVCVLGRTFAPNELDRWQLAFNFQFGHLFVAGIAIYGVTAGRKLVPALLLAMAALIGGMPDIAHVSAAASAKVLLFAALVWGASRLRLPDWAVVIASFLGGISYSLYLLHQSIGYNLIYHLEQRGMNANHAIAVTIAVMVLAAYLIRRYVEMPSQNALLQWYKRRSGRVQDENKGLGTKLSTPIDVQ